jgi:putative tryptophan/tyrosine transport system substrate-binding protein
MDRRQFLLTSAAGALAAPLGARAQQVGRVYRIGIILTAASSEAGHLTKALDERLRELGYVEGRNIAFERRFAEGKQERLRALAEELVRLKVDVIVAGSNPVVAAIKQTTATIPVVMPVSRDPVGAGFVASLSRPGGNITGLSNDPGPEIHGKGLAILKEAVPGISRVAYLWNPVPPGSDTYRKAVESAATRLGVTLRPTQVRGRDEFERAFTIMVQERADAVVVAQDPLLFSARSQLALQAATHRLPAMYGNREYVEAGGLMSYGPNIADQWRHAATYVDKILKGTKPGDLPIEQPTRFELVINLKTAKALGLTIPPLLLTRADQVIDRGSPAQ